MNHIAHCFLSLPDEDLLLGNFIGDFVKGKSWQTYPPGVRQGILLHRAIDAFTDEHPFTRNSIARLRPYAGRYSAPVTDILYDHLLSLSWASWSPDLSFDDFAAWAYTRLDTRREEMPPELRQRWPQMRDGRFLHGYLTREGMEWVLRHFNRRLAGHFDADALIWFFFEEIGPFMGDFKAFFPELMRHVQRHRLAFQ